MSTLPMSTVTPDSRFQVDEPSTLRGSCACGSITLTSTELPTSISICHCTTCRKIAGAPFQAFASFPPSTRLSWTCNGSSLEQGFISNYADEDHPRTPDGMTLLASPLALRGFCQACASPLFMLYRCRPSEVSVVMGIVDESSVDGELPRPKEHIFWASRVGWLDWEDMVKEDGVKRWDGFDEPVAKKLEEWKQKQAEPPKT